MQQNTRANLSNLFNRVWVTGAGGLIGSYFIRMLRGLLPEANVVPVLRSKVDLRDTRALQEAFRADKPDLVIHCAAMSRSPDCEANPAGARKINVEATRVLAELAQDCALLFMSSDQVFDGRNPPYTETSPPNPLSMYAETKVLAEQIVLANPKHIVIRTSLNGGASPTGDRGLDEQVCMAWKAGRELSFFTDEFRCPAHARETARAACELLLKGCAGIYHVAGSERISRWELGLLIARRWPELNPRLRPGSLKEYKGPPRPADLTMNCSKSIAVLGRSIPGFPEWLRAARKEEL
jgi:dTDP-4-dehydrorhamnose reductase